jgi:hypothetical protein
VIPLRRALRAARELGVRVEHKGDLVLKFPGLPAFRVNATRKDSVRPMATWLRRAEQAARTKGGKR